MITGTVFFAVEVNVKDEDSLTQLSAKIEKTVKGLESDGVVSCEETDSDVQEVEDEQPED